MAKQFTDDEKQFLKRLEELMERVDKRFQEEVTDFLEPHLQLLAEPLLKRQGQAYLYCGGHAEAERKRLVILPPYIEPDCALAGIVLVRLKGNMAFVKADHRDFLGAILSLGIKREKFGDLYVVEDGCYVYTSAEIADYLILNCPRVKGVRLEAQSVALTDWLPPEPAVKPITALVASMRIDTIAAHGFGLSRAKTIELIKQGKVKLNHQEVADADEMCQAGDVISFRGKGKLKIAEVAGETKKGKLRVELLKYI